MLCGFYNSEIYWHAQDAWLLSHHMRQAGQQLIRKKKVKLCHFTEEDLSGCLSECVEYDPNCDDCLTHREEATKEGNVHKSVRDVFSDAIEKMDSNYSQWVNSNSVLKFVVVLPARVCYKATKVRW